MRKTMKIDNETEYKLVEMIPDLNASNHKSIEEAKNSKDRSRLMNIMDIPDVSMLMNIKYYFGYLVIHCASKEEAIDITKKLILYGYVLAETGDMYFPGYFGALLTVLQLRFEINIFPIGKISYDAFERSYAQNLEKYLPKDRCVK